MKARSAVAFARALWRAYGFKGSLHRAWFEVRKKTGGYKADASPIAPAALTSPLPAAWSFAVDAARVREAADRGEGIARADRVLAGEYQAFRWTWMPLPTSADGWLTNPATGFRYDARPPWITVAHYSPAAGDVKDVWEPARFGWSYDLMRGFLLTGDDRYAEAFWRLMETFLESSVAFRGVQWSCGQESSIRALALLRAESVFEKAPSSTTERMQLLRRALVWTAERVEDAIGYAIVQRNNHGISEACGLLAIGARFLNAEPRAQGWFNKGKQLLERQIPDQFAADGWYVQHSFNYMRLALEQLVVAELTLRARGSGLSASARERVAASVALLNDVVDPASGRVPNHGPNDGAYVMPLSTAPYSDFRPVITAAAALFGSTVHSSLEPNTEVLAWLGLSAPAAQPSKAESAVRKGASGWVVARTSSVFLFTRAGKYRSRPSHIDALHVDLWVDGRPIAIDAGTFRYYAAPPWVNGLVIPEVHNTVTIEGLPMAERGPRYLWTSWPSASVASADVTREGVRVEMANQSWRAHGIAHTRICEIDDRNVTVTDLLQAPPSFSAPATVQWLLDEDADVLSVEGSRDTRIQVTTGKPDSLFGWTSDGYGDRRAVTSVRGTALLTEGSLKLISRFDLSRLGRTASRQVGVGTLAARAP